MTVRKFYAADMAELGPRTVRVVCSSDIVDRMGEVIDQAGIDLSAFRQNPIILWSHNPEHPIGTAKSIAVTDGKLQAEIEFAPEGMSHKADEICGLVKAGLVKTVSIGFDDLETEPMNPSRPKGPQRYLKSLLLEVSFVSIPANPEATVTERALKAKAEESAAPEWTVGAARDLSIGDDVEWDGPGAAKRMLDHAESTDGDIDASIAKRGFLVYDSAKATERGAYKLPFADLIDGKLKAMPGGIRAAASRLPDTDISDEARAKAEKVLAAYKKKAGIGEDDTKGAGARRTKGYDAMKIKGLYDLGQLVYVLSSLGYAQECARIETALEGDDSKLPEMLADAARQVGAALIAMTVEEVGELLTNLAVESDEDELDGVEAADVVVIQTSATPALRKFRAGLYRAKALAGRTKAGRRLSAVTMKCLKEMRAKGEETMGFHRSAIASHKECMKALDDLVDDNELEPEEDPDDAENGGDGTKSAAFLTKAQRLAEAKRLRVA